VFYDPPHLLKNIRNNLKKLGFKFGENNVLWQHIVSFYSSDSGSPIRMAPKLTQNHVLSHSVAAGISTHVSLGGLPPDAMHTAHFIEKLDQLFNSSQFTT